MKKIIYLISALFLTISCTEEIDIDLNSSDPQIVVEGNLPNNGQPALIKLSKSVNFDENNDFPKVEGATVELSDNLGNSETLDEISPGLYSSNTLTGIAGNTYYLTVNKEDKTLKSHSTIPNQVPFERLIVEKSNGAGGPGGMGSTTNYDVFVVYNDPGSETNYYRFVEIINGEIKSSYIFDDRLNNGGKTKNPLISFNRNLNSGDTLQVIMQCVDENVYDYFNSFGNLTGGPGGSSTPANPYTNIEGGVLGYFNAHTYEMKQVIF
ncbi:MAG: DUF4249 domain-containing protein [Bacteroidota bacterium]